MRASCPFRLSRRLTCYTAERRFSDSQNRRFYIEMCLYHWPWNICAIGESEETTSVLFPFFRAFCAMSSARMYS